MTASRKTPAPSNGSSGTAGGDYMDAVAREISGLWQYAQVPVSNIGGTPDAITGQVDVPLDEMKKGQGFIFTPLAPNTSATATIDFGRGPLNITNRDGSAVTAQRLSAGRTEVGMYDGASLRLMLDQPVNTRGYAILMAAYQTATGTTGGAFNQGFNLYPLNTLIVNEMASASFNPTQHQLTLTAGTYEADFDAWAHADRTKFVLWNATDNQIVPGQVSLMGYSWGIRSTYARFSLSTPKIIQVNAFNVTTDGNADALGSYVGMTTPVALPEYHGVLRLRSFL